MKLRIKYKSTRTTVEVESTSTVSELLEKCKGITSEGEWYLSLNGVDEVIFSSDSTVNSIGLVSGDLLHIVQRPKLNEVDDLVDKLKKLGFDLKSVEKVVHSFGATNLNDAIELLNMLGASNLSTSTFSTAKKVKIPADAPSTSSQNETKTFSDSLKKDVKMLTTSDNTANHKVVLADKSCSTRGTSAVATFKTDKSSNLMSDLLLQDGVTDKLVELCKQVKCETAADYLCLLIHALMDEAGFKHQSSSSEQSMNTGDDDTNDRHNVTGLPENWRNSIMGLYRFNYTHNLSKAMSCCLTASVMGTSILVSGILDQEESEAYQTKLKINDFIKADEIQSSTPHLVYVNLKKLSHKVKGGIAIKIVNEIRSRLGISLGLLTLPLEVQLRIISLLDVQTICHLSQVDRGLNNLCNIESVWKTVLQRQFGRDDSKLVGTTYKEAVKLMHRMRREERVRADRERERLRIPRQPLRPDFDIGPDLIYPGIATEFPGMIGGYHDLNPYGGYQPGGFPQGPQHPDLLHGRYPGRGDLRRPPGARFDPYGPIPDDGYGPSRQPNHPDMLHRPNFGRGSGGGGYGFS